MKTRKNRMVSILLAMVLAFSFAGCGNIIPAMNEKDSEKMTEEVTEMLEDVTSLDEIIADADEPVQQSIEADMTAEQTTESAGTTAPVETEEPAQTAEPDATEKPIETKKSVETEKPAETLTEDETVKIKTAESASARTSVPAQNTTAPAKSEQQTTESSVPVTTPTPAPAATPTPEPVHEHSWKEHVVTNQIWVPNIVVVDDYETRYVEVGSHYICACGQCETDDPDTISNHVKDSVRANDGLPHNFTIWPLYGEQTVKVGSHEEDQGHYETSSYVDYYYCDCGAKK